MKAIQIRKEELALSKFQDSVQIHFRFEPPLAGHEYGLACSTTFPALGKKDTVILPSNKNGDILSWEEIAGDAQTADIGFLVTSLGYRIVEGS